jgi:FtsP/CotA-like multicopper oxidase with cupredoxin domain
MPVPPVLQPDRSDADGDHYTIIQRVGEQRIDPLRGLTPIEGFNGMWPGPTIVARRGRPVTVTQVNQLSHPVTTHNHGHRVRPESDGHPADFLLPGASRDYHYPNEQNSGTYWLHDHSLDATSLNVMAGLASFYIIKDDNWERLNFPSGEFDIPLLIQERALDGDDRLTTEAFAAPAGFGGDGAFNAVNGVRTPYLEVAQRRYLFRILNGSDVRRYRIQFRVGDQILGRDAPMLPFRVVASDGGLLNNSVIRQFLQLAPAERYAIVIDFAQLPLGTVIQVINTDTSAPIQDSTGTFQVQLPDVMTMVVTRPAVDDSTPVPDQLLETPIETLNPDTADVHRTVSFTARANRPDLGNFLINNMEFDPGRIDFHAKLGQTETWRIENTTPFYHNIHFHLVQFQVRYLAGGVAPEEMNGWKDTVVITPFQSVELTLRWEGYSGIYVLHCHVLHHEDIGMMAQIEVSP